MHAIIFVPSLVVSIVLLLLVCNRIASLYIIHDCSLRRAFGDLHYLKNYKITNLKKC